MACILILQCNFTHRYFRCILPEATINVEVRVKTMKGIHTYRRDCTIQEISCKPWNSRLCPHPSLVRKMQTFLELEGQISSQPHDSPYQVGKTTSPWKTPVPKRAADKMRRTKTPMKRQFKVRLVEKPLPINIKSEPVTTTATATQTSMVKPTATAAKLNTIPLTVYNLTRPKSKKSLIPQ